jgi:hypothetical protein
MDILKGFVYSKHFAVGSRSEKEMFLLQTKKKGDFIIEYSPTDIIKFIRKIVEIEGTLKPSNILDHGAVTSSFVIVASKIKILDDGLIPD